MCLKKPEWAIAAYPYQIEDKTIMKCNSRCFLPIVVTVMSTSTMAAAADLGTAFTVQNGTSLVDGIACDFEFTPWDAVGCP